MIVFLIVFFVLVVSLGAIIASVCVYTSSPPTAHPSPSISPSSTPTPHVYIMSAQETYQVIAQNKDFYQQFNDFEWNKRNVNGYKDYMKIVKPLCVTLTAHQKSLLRKKCLQADRRLSQIQLPYFDGKKAVQIPWKIGIFRSSLYEFGFPHTIDKSIVLNEEILSHKTHHIISTLIHEKVHIYQRFFNADIQIYLNMFEFTPWKRRDSDDITVRPNPDLDSIIYLRRGHPYVLGSDQLHPDEQGKIDPNSQFYEHPFERMAIEIARQTATPI